MIMPSAIQNSSSNTSAANCLPPFQYFITFSEVSELDTVISAELQQKHLKTHGAVTARMN